MRVHLPPRARQFAVLLPAAALTVAACTTTSSASPSGAASSPATGSAAASGSSASPAASSSAAAGGAQGSDVAITAKDFAYDLPQSVPAGVVNITLSNSGKEEHQAQLAKIADGKTVQDVVAALAKQDMATAFSIITFVGGPTGVQPGGTQTITANLAPGNYMALCFVEGADGVPHFAKGMVAPFTVTGTAAGGQLPAAAAALTLQDFAFVGLNTLPTGSQVVTVTNKGPQPHEATVVKLAPGVTLNQLVAAATAPSPPPGPPPFTDIGGTAAIAPNSTANVTLNLPAGNYAFVCFVPDPASGKAHFQLGMIGGLTVK
jgi:plastocyanin